MQRQIWELVTDHTCLLGEGPVWSSVAGSILWVDILRGEIHRFSIALNEHEVMRVGQKVGAIALRASGGLIAALQNGFAGIDLENKTVHPIADPESHLPDNRFNDGKCDPAGRFWAGTMDDVNAKKGVGTLYVLNSNLSHSVRIREVTCSNGLAWSPNQNTLYYIDTATRQVVSYHYDIGSGSIRNRKVAFAIPEDEGYPDGMTIDTEGMLWIAHWEAGKISRREPGTGRVLASISLPASRITSCTFGGDNLDDLYVTSARVGLTERQLKEQPLSGSLFVIKNSGFKGLDAVAFRG